MTEEQETPEVIDHLAVYRTDKDVIFPLYQPDGDAQIWVHKLGGGYLDTAYTGTWICQVHQHGELKHSTCELNTGMPHTHYEAAGVYADFLVHAEDGPLIEDEGGLLDALEEFASEATERHEKRSRRESEQERGWLLANALQAAAKGDQS